MVQSDIIDVALSLSRGARFFRCALQVNPYEYLRRHAKMTTYSDEASYNRAIIDACLESGVEVIAITDHYRIQLSERLIKEASDAGIRVFPGFEAVCKDGVHMLCLFEPGVSIDKIERVIGDCGIHTDDSDSPAGKYDTLDFLCEVREWGAVCIATHVCSDGGLLKTLQAQARVNAWRSNDLMVCSLPGSISDAPENVKPILKNKDKAYQREHSIAIINARDVNGPDDLRMPGSSSLIKMTEVSLEGLRQAFLDPVSRIRLETDPAPQEHIELVAIGWQGGFLDNQALHFNENLNVLIGGRGTGKSTVIESLRCVLDLRASAQESQVTYESIVKSVLRNATKISLLVDAHRPARKRYRIERTIPNPPVVRDESGQVLSYTPTDIIPNVQVFGQHEISELSKDPAKRTLLLERFIEYDPELENRKADLREELSRLSYQILDSAKEIAQIDEKLSTLPTLEETLKRYHEAGLEDKFKERSILVTEEQVIKETIAQVDQCSASLRLFKKSLPIKRDFLSEIKLAGLPNKDILAKLDTILESLNTKVETSIKDIEAAINTSTTAIVAIRQEWQPFYDSIQTKFEKTLRDLRKASINAEEFIRLRQQIEALRPLKEKREDLQKELETLKQRRHDLLANWEDLKATSFQQLEKAAKKVSRELSRRVRVQVTFAGDRGPLINLIKSEIGGRLSEALDILRAKDSLSITDFVKTITEGKESLIKNYGFSPTQAEKIAGASQEFIMNLEQLDLPHTANIELNVAAESLPDSWQGLDSLSTGQKATALLFLLLLESDSPLIIDQPEDDLDNRFITEGIVPKMRDEKRRRQFIFTTHNANIPVLGDADLIACLDAVGDADRGHTIISPENIGSIDVENVQRLVKDILEGGKEAFELRRLKYGF